MTAEERWKKFQGQVDDFINNRNLQAPAFNEEFRAAEQLTATDLSGLIQADCFDNAYMLYQYAEYVASEKAQQDIVILWCDKALSEMLSKEYGELSQYINHDMKIGMLVADNDVAQLVSNWRATAMARVTMLHNKEYNIRKKADCLMEKGKRQ